jgi:hypothetical protein
MGLLRNRALWAALFGLVLSGLLLILGAGYLGLVVVSGLLSGAQVVGTLLDIAVPVIVGGAFLVVLVLVSGVAFLYVLLRSLSFPRSARAASVIARLENVYPPLGRGGLSDRLAPPEPSPGERAERALADLKSRYVNGEMTEAEFERRVDRLVSNEPVDEVRADRERERERVVEAGSGRH